MLLLQFSPYSGSDEYFAGPIRRRITDKAPMSLPSGKRGDLSQKSEEGSLKLSSMLSPYGLKNENSLSLVQKRGL